MAETRGTGSGQGDDNVVRVDSPSTPPPSSPQNPDRPAYRPAPYVPSADYSMGGNFYYHPSLGVGTMTGVWGDSRSGGRRRHEGQDIRMPMNTPLVAVTSGTIQHYKNSSAGTVIYLKGDDGNKYSYFHLNSRIAKNGQRVKAGQRIAYSGNSGNSTGPHLHFETWINGKKEDPRPFLSHTRSPQNGQVDPTQGGDPYFEDQAPVEPGGELDFFGAKQFYDDAQSIFGQMQQNMNMPDPNKPYGQWADELRSLQSELAQKGLAKAPRKLKASNMVRNVIAGMSDMVKRDGYTSGFAGGGGGGQYSTPGSNVVAPPEEQ